MASGPSFFVDRGVGSRIVPDGLRAIGWQVVTMDERYGKGVSQRVPDIEWISDAARKAEVILTKDRAIVKRSLEARAIATHAARVFVVGSANITGRDTLERILLHQARIERMLDRPGPFVFAIGRDRLDLVQLRSP